MSYYTVAAAQPAHAFAQPGLAQHPASYWPQAAVANPWAQAGQAPVYGQHPAAAWAHASSAAFASSAGFGHPAATYQHPAAAYQYGMVSQVPDQRDLVDLFMEQLGIQPEEDVYFAFIAEYGLQDDAMPTRWQIHTDAATGRDYYVDGDSGESSWEHPLTQTLRRVLDIGRVYLRAPTETFFNEQKQAIWDQHLKDLESWHGPLADDEGRQYFSNSVLGVSSWHDPREETQFIFEIESNLLDALKDTLPDYGPEDLPAFGGSGGAKKDVAAPHSPKEPRSPQSPKEPQSPPNRPCTPRSALTIGERVAQGLEQNQACHRTVFKKMMKDADYVNYMLRDAEEAQLLTIKRKVRDRERRKKGFLEAEVRKRQQEEAIKMALAAAEEEKKAEIVRKMREEQQRAEEDRQKKLAEEEAARKEEERKLEEERQRVLAEKEAARLEEERKEREEADRRRREKEAREEAERKRKEARENLIKRVKEAANSKDLEVLRNAIKEGEAAGLTDELRQVRLAFKDELLAQLENLIDSRDVSTLRVAIADGEAAGFSDEQLAPVRKALEDELARRKAEKIKARKAKEDLAAQFKNQKEAHELGGAILVAQWKAAVREVAKPFEE